MLQFQRRKLVLIVLCLVLGRISVSGQLSDTSYNGANNPFTYFGYGQLQYQGLQSGQMMGRTGTAHQSNFQVNTINPAGLASIRLTTLDFSLGGNSNKTTTASSTLKSGDFTPRYFNLAVPIGKNGGCGFGVKPYINLLYRVGYNQSIPVNDTSLTTVNRILGKGDINRLNVSGAYRIKNFSFGADIFFVFGNTNVEQYLSFKDTVNIFGTDYKRNYSFGGFSYNLGAQYSYKIDSAHAINIGITYTTNNKITSREYGQVTNFFYRNVNTLDTFVSFPEDKGKFVIPSEFNIGLGYRIVDKMEILFDYRNVNWKKNSLIGQTKSLYNYSQFALGMAYTPMISGPRANLLSASTYSLGFYGGNDYIKVNNEGVNFWGITSGFSLPFKTFRGSSGKVHFGIDFMSQGSLSSNALRNTHTQYLLGISFSDGTWFAKRYYD